jgi:hypothetical protein
MGLARQIADAVAGLDWVLKVRRNQYQLHPAGVFSSAPPWAAHVALDAVEAEARARVEKLLPEKNQAKEEKEA